MNDNANSKASKVFLLNGAEHTVSPEEAVTVIEQMRDDGSAVIEFTTRRDTGGAYVMTALKSATVGILSYIEE